MSGGSYDYAYHWVSDFAEVSVLPYHTYEGEELERPCLELRLKLAKHLKDVAHIMRMVEWTDSGDIGKEQLEKELVSFLEKLK